MMNVKRLSDFYWPVDEKAQRIKIWTQVQFYNSSLAVPTGQIRFIETLFPLRSMTRALGVFPAHVWSEVRIDDFSSPLLVQLQGVQKKWASDPLLRPLSLRAGQLANTLSVLLQKSIFYLKKSDPTYLRGKSRVGLLHQR